MTLAAVKANIISAGCNQTSCTVDWGNNGIIAYGSNSSVALYQPLSSNEGRSEVLCTLVGHTMRVNCIKWIRLQGTCHNTSKDDGELVSGSVDCTAIVWTQTSPQLKFVVSSTLEGHTGAVTSLDAIKTFDNATLIATASADSTVKIWEKSGSGRDGTCSISHAYSMGMKSDFCDIQTISFGNGFALDVSLSALPHLRGSVLLACGVTDHKVHVYSRSANQFVLVQQLGGHEDWVRSVAFSPTQLRNLMLASSAQDHMIRIWGIECHDSVVRHCMLEPQTDISLFSIYHSGGVASYIIKLDTVLSGHDNWVYSVCWRPMHKDDERVNQPCLLSASMDKTMIIWQLDISTGVWRDQVRVGEFGGNTLGFYGALFNPQGDGILSHGYHGAFHQWHLSEDLQKCTPVVTVQGHFDAVTDIAWDPMGHFLVTMSTDQTTRIYAPWNKNGICQGWFEIARPQIHGYDMQCLAIITSFCFASGADEKVIRIFEAPSNFLQSLYAISGVGTQSCQISDPLPHGAKVPALGLSNKAVFDEQATDPLQHLNDKNVCEGQSECNFTSDLLTEPPMEEHLLQNTLWPETRKLYGHSYELYALTASPDGNLLASACKATKAVYAGIILWDTSSWRRICTLDGPSLTVTELQFSPLGGNLLAVSRDRTWRLYSISHDTGKYSLIANIDKKTSVHARIIWSCCWSHDSVYFATASRDKKVAVWMRENQMRDITKNAPCGPVLHTGDSATAVAIAPVCLANGYVMAVGLDNGVIMLYSWVPQPPTWTVLGTIDRSTAHFLTVKRLRFRPNVSTVESGDNTAGGNAEYNQPQCGASHVSMQLASCSSDLSVRIYDLYFKNTEKTAAV